MVGSTNRYHRQGPVAAHQVDLTHMKERKGRALDGGVAVNAGGPAAVGLNEPLGGFIFMCNNETMPEDLERQLFGFQAIRKGSIAGMTIAILHIHAGLSYVLYWNLTLERVGPYHLITRASLSILLFISRKSATVLATRLHGTSRLGTETLGCVAVEIDVVAALVIGQTSVVNDDYGVTERGGGN
ncbi:uncharacterized protein [Physcomitrium patens]|uniref:uncharacterized protein n=1 Tax=Physcomitrium patens TaxID=3218 RepID=UPI003CCD414C